MKEQEEHEKMVLEKIKVKMDRIKATQEKLHTKTATEPQSHSEGKFLLLLYQTTFIGDVVVDYCIAKIMLNKFSLLKYFVTN